MGAASRGSEEVRFTVLDWRRVARGEWPGQEFESLVDENYAHIVDFCDRLQGYGCKFNSAMGSCEPLPNPYEWYADVVWYMLLTYMVKEAFRSLVVVYFVIRGSHVGDAWANVCQTSVLCPLFVLRGSLNEVPHTLFTLFSLIPPYSTHSHTHTRRSSTPSRSGKMVWRASCMMGC
jgi:hypothetical protein